MYASWEELIASGVTSVSMGTSGVGGWEKEIIS